MRVLLWVVMLSVVAMPAQAGKKRAAAAKFNKKAVPPGEGWFCVTMSTYSISGSICVRDEDDCHERAQNWVDGDYGRTAGDCVFKAKAATFTYYSVLDEEAGHWAASSFVDCKSMRKLFASQSEDYSKISACKAIGDVAWPKGTRPAPSPPPAESDEEPTPENGVCAIFSTSGVEATLCYWNLW